MPERTETHHDARITHQPSPLTTLWSDELCSPNIDTSPSTCRTLAEKGFDTEKLGRVPDDEKDRWSERFTHRAEAHHYGTGTLVAAYGIVNLGLGEQFWEFACLQKKDGSYFTAEAGTVLDHLIQFSRGAIKHRGSSPEKSLEDAIQKLVALESESYHLSLEWHQYQHAAQAVLGSILFREEAITVENAAEVAQLLLTLPLGAADLEDFSRLPKYDAHAEDRTHRMETDRQVHALCHIALAKSLNRVHTLSPAVKEAIGDNLLPFLKCSKLQGQIFELLTVTGCSERYHSLLAAKQTGYHGSEETAPDELQQFAAEKSLSEEQVQSILAVLEDKNERLEFRLLAVDILQEANEKGSLNPSDLRRVITAGGKLLAWESDALLCKRVIQFLEVIVADNEEEPTREAASLALARGLTSQSPEVRVSTLDVLVRQPATRTFWRELAHQHHRNSVDWTSPWQDKLRELAESFLDGAREATEDIAIALVSTALAVVSCGEQIEVDRLAASGVDRGLNVSKTRKLCIEYLERKRERTDPQSLLLAQLQQAEQRNKTTLL
ncbi:hypothetical protein MRY87_07245 [bacterium]|nr:hypothetical protein [bacterium]